MRTPTGHSQVSRTSIRIRYLPLVFALLLTSPPQILAQQPAMQMTMPIAATPELPDSLPPLASPVDLLKDLQTRPPLSLDDLIASGLTSNPALAQSRSLTTRTEALARQAALYPNPAIGYQGDQIRGGSFGGGEQGAFLAQTIPLGGKLTLRRKALEAEAATTRTSTEIQQTRIRADITQAFYSTLAAQEAAHIRRDLFLVAQDAVKTAHQLANVGQADAPDLLAAEVEQEQAQLADEQAQRLVLARFHTLAILVGAPNLLVTPLKADLSATPTADLTHLFDDNPLTRQAQARIAAAEVRLASAHREVAPDLELKAGEQYNFEQLANSPVGPTRLSKVGPQTFASAAITIPVWNHNQGNIQAAEADLDSARQNLRRILLSLSAQTEPLITSLATATTQATRYRSSILPRAARATQLYEQKYNQMAQAYPQVLIARRNLLELNLQYTQILAEIWRTTTILNNAGLSGSLAPVPTDIPASNTTLTPLD